jgi:hypothetical protein
MDSQQTFTYLLERLEYKASPTFISSEVHNNISPEIVSLWNEAKEKLQVDAIYCIASAPIIYFRRFEAFWGIEREEIKAGEMRTLPFPFLDSDQEKIAIIAQLVDELSQIASQSKTSKKNLNLALFQENVSKGIFRIKVLIAHKN